MSERNFRPHQSSQTAKVLGSLREAFSHVNVRESMKEDLESAKDQILNFVEWAKVEGETWEHLHPQLVSLVKELTKEGFSLKDLAPAISKAKAALSKLGGVRESLKKGSFFHQLRESSSLKEGYGNVWVQDKKFYEALLKGVKKVFPNAYQNRYKEIVIPAEEEQDDTGLHIEAWSDCVYVVADCANPAIYGETMTQKDLSEAEFDPKDQYYFLRSLTDFDWETLGEEGAKAVQKKGISVK